MLRPEIQFWAVYGVQALQATGADPLRIASRLNVSQKVVRQIIEGRLPLGPACHLGEPKPKSGYPGITVLYLKSGERRYRAKFNHRGRRLELGTFITVEAASSALEAQRYKMLGARI